MKALNAVVLIAVVGMAVLAQRVASASDPIEKLIPGIITGGPINVEDLYRLGSTPSPITFPATTGQQQYLRVVVLIHAHDDQSDGVPPPVEAVQLARASGAQVVFLTDHADEIRDVYEWGRLIHEAGSGYAVEVPLGRPLQVTGYGQSHLLFLGPRFDDFVRVVEIAKSYALSDPDTAILHLRRMADLCGGVLIAAHPCHEVYPFQVKWLRFVDAVEVFDHGPKDSPRDVIELGRANAVRAVTGGSDFHGGLGTALTPIHSTDLSNLFYPEMKRQTLAWCTSATPEGVIEAVRAGRCKALFTDEQYDIATTNFSRTQQALAQLRQFVSRVGLKPSNGSSSEKPAIGQSKDSLRKAMAAEQGPTPASAPASVPNLSGRWEGKGSQASGEQQCRVILVIDQRGSGATIYRRSDGDGWSSYSKNICDVSPGGDIQRRQNEEYSVVGTNEEMTQEYTCRFLNGAIEFHGNEEAINFVVRRVSYDTTPPPIPQEEGPAF